MENKQIKPNRRTVIALRENQTSSSFKLLEHKIAMYIKKIRNNLLSKKKLLPRTEMPLIVQNNKFQNKSKTCWCTLKHSMNKKV